MEGVQAALTPDEVLDSEAALVRATACPRAGLRGWPAPEPRCRRVRAWLQPSYLGPPSSPPTSGSPRPRCAAPARPQKRNPQFVALVAERYGITDVERQLALDPWYSGYRWGRPEGRVLQFLLYARGPGRDGQPSMDDNHYARVRRRGRGWQPGMVVL